MTAATCPVSYGRTGYAPASGQLCDLRPLLRPSWQLALGLLGLCQV